MEILIAAIIAAGAAFGFAKKDGTLEKGYDTTYKDTIRFEYSAALNTKERSQAKAERLETVMQSWGPTDERTVGASEESTVTASQEPGI